MRNRTLANILFLVIFLGLFCGSFSYATPYPCEGFEFFVDGLKFTPDGNWIVFATSNMSNDKLFCVPEKGGKLVVLDSLCHPAPNGNYLPDKKYFAYVDDAGVHIKSQSISLGNQGPKKAQSESTSKLKISLPDWKIGDQKISPNGKKIAFFRTDGEGPDLWVMNIDGSSLIPLAPKQRVSDLAWSPDSSRLAIVCGEHRECSIWYDRSEGFNFGTSAYGDEVWVINADGTGLHKLTDLFSIWEPAIEVQRLETIFNRALVLLVSIPLIVIILLIRRRRLRKLQVR